mgnify:CR=1 FL=1
MKDRHFLELLVMSEINCLAHPLHDMTGQPGQAERVHRHANRVRRVACERIGAERLHAYCERVKEAFDAYMQSCEVAARGFDPTTEEMDSTLADEADEMEDGEEEEVEGRGRSREKGEGSVVRAKHPEPRSPTKQNDPFSDDMTNGDDDCGAGDGVDVPMKADFDEEDLLKIELDDVQEEEEDKGWVRDSLTGNADW